MKSKGIAIGAPVVPAQPASEPEEEGSKFGDDDHKPLFVGTPGSQQLEEEELARTLKGSIEIVLEEQAAQEDSYISMDFPGNFSISQCSLYIINA